MYCCNVSCIALWASHMYSHGGIQHIKNAFFSSSFFLFQSSPASISWACQRTSGSKWVRSSVSPSASSVSPTPPSPGRQRIWWVAFFLLLTAVKIAERQGSGYSCGLSLILKYCLVLKWILGWEIPKFYIFGCIVIEVKKIIKWRAAIIM